MSNYLSKHCPYKNRFLFIGRAYSRRNTYGSHRGKIYSDVNKAMIYIRRDPSNSQLRNVRLFGIKRKAVLQKKPNRHV